MDEKTYLELFLDNNNLPNSMSRVQDSRTRGADPGDSVFVRCRGEHSGMAAWMGPNTEPVWRLVDIRWVFPTEANAIEYHRTTLNINSEGQPLIPDAPKVGTDCYVFGLDNAFDVMTYEISGRKETITQFYYIFRVANVVVKLYIAEGEMAAQYGKKLTVNMVKQIAEGIVPRIEAKSRGQKPSLWRRLFS